MSAAADQLDRIADELLVEARGLDGIAGTIEPLVARVAEAWEGPAADRLMLELGRRQQELEGWAGSLRRVAGDKRAEARRIRAREASALTGAADPTPPAAGPAVPR